MYLPYLLCCCDWEIQEENHYVPPKPPRKPPRSNCNDLHYQEPLLQEMCDLQVNNSYNDVLFRNEYYSIPRDTIRRLMNALNRMVNGSSNNLNYFTPYFQTASYKKWASGYTSYIPKNMLHLWYRAYLHDFELALQKADIECGNDGKITLPYIDIKKNPCIPEILKNFKLDNDLIQANDELCKINTLFNDEERITRLVSEINITNYIASDNIDELLEKIIEAYGFNDSDYTSFHPFYYFVLCYIDRLYHIHSKFKMQNVTPRSPEYWKILVPFRKLPIELVDITNLGYNYL